jgi:hypothetical protein
MAKYVPPVYYPKSDDYKKAKRGRTVDPDILKGIILQRPSKPKPSGGPQRPTPPRSPYAKPKPAPKPKKGKGKSKLSVKSPTGVWNILGTK